VFTAITLHYPATQFVDELTEFMHAVMDGIRDAPGLIEAHVAEAADGSCLAGVTQWNTADDFARARPLILAFAPQRDPAWTTKPDEAIRLQSIERVSS
jgi:hypothetical protein